MQNNHSRAHSDVFLEDLKSDKTKKLTTKLITERPMSTYEEILMSKYNKKAAQSN